MAVNSVSSSADLTASYGVKSQREQQAVHQGGREVRPDNDGNDRSTSESKPTVNAHGQTIGKIINTKA